MLDFGYWVKVGKKLVGFVLSVVLIYVAFRLSVFYVPFLVAFVVAQLIEPVIRFCMRTLKMKRKFSAILILVVVLGVIVGVVVAGVITFISEAANLLGNVNYYFEKIYDFVQRGIGAFDFGKIQLSKELSDILSSSSQEFIGTASEWVKNVLTNILNAVTSLPKVGLCVVITVLALYFICTDKIYILDQIEHHLPEAWVKRLTKHFKALIKTLGCYLKAQAMLIFISFVISVIGLYIFSIIGLNVSYPLLSAIGIAIVDALPIFGSGTIMVPWAIIASCNGDLQLGICILILWIIMSVVRQVVEPKIVSGQIGIHPIFTLIAMYTGFKFMGFLGIYLGPIVLIILKEIYGNRIDKGFVKSIFD